MVKGSRKSKATDATRERKYHMTKMWRRRVRQHFLHIYGSVCECCGETNQAFLTLDHVQGGGSRENANNGYSNYTVMRDAIKKRDPNKYRILCWNCNSGRYVNGGICPHVMTKTVVVCGSMKNSDAMFAWAAENMYNFNVVLPPLNRTGDSEDLNRTHWNKIKSADIVLIVNPDGYVGVSTFSEIAVARYLNKPVYLTRPISSDSAGLPELLTWQLDIWAYNPKVRK